jgi:DNA-binding response OmpR family regulator
MKVCVIDDDPLMLEHIAEMAKGLGFEVVSADNVDTGLRLIESQGPICTSSRFPEEDVWGRGAC